MICKDINTLLGFKCHPIEEDGSVALIDTAFQFQDGDFVPVYVQYLGEQIKFFDGGETILHFMNRGINFSRSNSTRFIKNLASHNGVTFTKNGEIEIWSHKDNAQKGFANFMSTMLSIVRWEHDQQGINTDISLLIDEVAMCFKAAFPQKEQLDSPDFIGISGHKYKFDFIHGNDAVITISSHPNSVAAALKKLIDINQLPENSSVNPLVVLDDRSDKLLASNQAKILTAASRVLNLTTLYEKAGFHQQQH